MEATRHCTSNGSYGVKTMTQILLVRHGETAWNAEEVFRGQADIPLNKNGLKQAQLLGEYLSRKKIDAVYSSPLKRALKTAEAIAVPKSLDVNVAPALIDMNFGKWQGLTTVEVKRQYGKIYQSWLEAPEQVTIPAGESLEDVRNRALPFLEEIVAKYTGQNVVLASHRVVHKVLICSLLKIGNAAFYNVKLDTAGITRFEFDKGRAVLVSHNDTSFLESIRGPALADF
jgi:broad specificity phosphatase PhoE